MPCLVALLAGCGAHHQLPGAEPAVSPAPARTPVGRIVHIGAGAEGIVVAPRAGVVAVAVRHPTRVALLAIRSGRRRRTLAIAGPARHLSLDGASTVLVPEAPIDRLLELPLGGGRPRSIVTGGLPHDAVALGGRIFVADEFGRAVSVLAGGRSVARIGPFTQPGGITAVDGRVALIDVGADTVSLIDPHSLRILARVHAGAGLTHAAPGPDGRLYVVDTRGDALLTFATTPRLRLIDRLPLPGRPYGICSDPGRDRLWVTETATDRLVELAIGRPRPHVVATLPVVRQPNTVAVDPATGEVYVAGAAAGVVEQVGVAR